MMKATPKAFRVWRWRRTAGLELADGSMPPCELAIVAIGQAKLRR